MTKGQFCNPGATAEKFMRPVSSLEVTVGDDSKGACESSREAQVYGTRCGPGSAGHRVRRTCANAEKRRAVWVRAAMGAHFDHRLQSGVQRRPGQTDHRLRG